MSGRSVCSAPLFVARVVGAYLVRVDRHPVSALSRHTCAGLAGLGAAGRRGARSTTPSRYAAIVSTPCRGPTHANTRICAALDVFGAASALDAVTTQERRVSTAPRIRALRRWDLSTLRTDRRLCAAARRGDTIAIDHARDRRILRVIVETRGTMPSPTRDAPAIRSPLRGRDST